MIIYSKQVSARLLYIVDFISKELEGRSAQVTSNQQECASYQGIRINYSDEALPFDAIRISPGGLLFQQGIVQQEIHCFQYNGLNAFFQTRGDYPFDLFSASFYLLSRYEEYLPHKMDAYGRYAHENSVAFREQFLHLPLVNFWLDDFRQIVAQRFPRYPLRQPVFTFLPTYDIDIAWSYRHKGWWRNLGGLLRSSFKWDWAAVRERVRVLAGRQNDPFDCYGWLNKLHERHQLKPYYFFLVPKRRGRYDKNISPSVPAMQYLVQDHVIRYPIGIHPSWKSGDVPNLLAGEINQLSALNGTRILSSRQHYIRFNLPVGYRRLLENGIRFDFSMGYGSINGFRASVATPFYWYDLEREKQTELLLFPFCFMEANSFYEQKYSAQQALEELRQYYNTVRSVNGYFIMIWHNTFLGTDKLYSGWRTIYEQFINEVSQASRPAN